MTTKRIVFERPDGGITVRVPAPKGRRLGEPEEQWLERLANKNPDGRVVGIVEADDLPDRSYRNAWRVDAHGIFIDPTEKARIDEERNKPTLEERIAALESQIGRTKD